MNTNGTDVESLELIAVVAVGVLAMGWLSRRTGLSEPLLLLGAGCLVAREDLVGFGYTDQ
ncbi:hypothetical protein [Streptomyces mirabilis]|uniref:hypothetical protein n=1 Tax=Streptomyces mirabilis TaxID=68239 RepID=UPI0036DA7CA4